MSCVSRGRPDRRVSVRPLRTPGPSAECLRRPHTVVRDGSGGHGARPAIFAPIGTLEPPVARDIYGDFQTLEP